MRVRPLILFVGLCLSHAAHADGDLPAPENWALHGQLTNVTQSASRFNAAYTGGNSLDPKGRTEETTDLTLYAGLRLWRGAELWVNTEVDQGFGLSNTLGMAGFPSGEAYKVGANTPYLRLPRAFIRQVIPFGGTQEKVEAAANQLAGSAASDNLTITIGKFSVVDIFDTNSYAHDPRGDFLNWAVIDAGAFDYAADAWGYTYGAALEWNLGPWTWRGGVFQLSPVPNGKVVKVDFDQYMLVGEVERRYQWREHPGKIKLLGFANRGRMASYRDAIAASPSSPDVAAVRKTAWRPGFSLNWEQEAAKDLGVFARVSFNDGGKEAYEFTEINRSLSAGMSLKGECWKRPDDTLGIAMVINALSDDARQYFVAGGSGILIGDGQLNYGAEKILEAYYSLQVNRYVSLAFDYQHVNNPAYNRDRGPVNIVAFRLHAQF